MNKVLVRAIAIGLAGGLFAIAPTVHAGENREAFQPAQAQTQSDEEQAWEAWNAEFWPMLEADRDYAAAMAAWLAYQGDDKEENARLEAVVDKRYRAIALLVYERHFGKWGGNAAEFDELIGIRAKSPLEECARVAIATCGAGGVCSVTVGPNSCSFTCQDGKGNCPVLE